MMDDIQARVRRLIAQVGAEVVHTVQAADPQEPLAGLDSLAMVELIVRAEKNFGVKIAAASLTPENFGSVAALAKMLRSSGAVSLGVHDLTIDGRLVPPDDKTVVDVLVDRAHDNPDMPFLTWLRAPADAEVLTYGGLEARSRSLAAWLAGPEGLSGEHVGLLAANDIPTVVALFAVLRAGGTCLLLNPTDPPERLRAVLAAHPVRTVLRSPQISGVLGAAGLTIPCLELDSGPASMDRPLAPDCPAMMFGTSGSTAASKVVLQSHRALLSNARGLQRHLKLGPDVTVMGGLPLHHVNGVHFTLIGVLSAGAHVILPQQFSPLTYRTELDAHRPHLASVVPSVLETLLATGRGWRPPDSLRFFVSAAAPMSASLAGRIADAFGVRVLQGYGLTETTNFSTMMPVDLTDSDYRALVLDADIPTVGVALLGNEVEVLSSAGDVVGPEEVGEVCMRGHNVMEGYVGASAATAEAFADGWFHSGDLGRWTTDSTGRRHLVLTGRIKNIAKVRGEAVSLEEVEHALLSLTGIVDAGCVSLPHPMWGEEIVAVVVPRQVSVAELHLQLAKLLPRAALPRRWYGIDTVPRTATGKLQRELLRRYVSLEEPL